MAFFLDILFGFALGSDLSEATFLKGGGFNHAAPTLQKLHVKTDVGETLAVSRNAGGDKPLPYRGFRKPSLGLPMSKFSCRPEKSGRCIFEPEVLRSPEATEG